MNKTSKSGKKQNKLSTPVRVVLIVLLILLLLIGAAYLFYHGKVSLLNHSNGVSAGDAIDASDSETMRNPTPWPRAPPGWRKRTPFWRTARS